MNNQKIISEYISKCVEKNICSQKDIFENLKEELAETDAILASVEDVRIKRAQLQKIFDYFNEIFQEEKAVSKFDDKNEEAVLFRSKIIEIIKAEGKPLSNREIINKIGQYNNDAKIIRALKMLHEDQIIDRTNDSEHKIIPGPNWK